MKTGCKKSSKETTKAIKSPYYEEIEISLKIVDASGKTILSNEKFIINKNFEKKFDLQTVSSGIYFIVFTYKRPV